MLYKLFDIYISINEKYEQTKRLLDSFVTLDTKNADISIVISDEEIKKELLKDSQHDEVYHEMVCIFRHITEQILDFQGMFIHSAVVEVNNSGFMFCGQSGTGKSTHAGEWKKYFGEKARIINGDKPIIRFFDNEIIAYGNPWCGTEGWFENAKTPLKAICFIKKAEKNRIRKLSSSEALEMIINQIVIPKSGMRKLKHFELLDRLLKEIPFYELECDISKEAVITAYNRMNNIV